MNLITKIFTLTILGSSFGTIAMADTIFRYEDKDGTIHFTDTVPDRTAFKKYTPKPLFIMKHSSDHTHTQLYSFATKGKISPMIQDLAQKHAVDPYLIEAIVKAESDYDVMAISKTGAQGLMQIMPGTGMDLGLVNPFDPQENLDAGIRHIKKLITKYSYNIDLVLAAYNAGELTVEKYKGIPPYPETIDYIQKIKKYYSQFSMQSTNSTNHSDFSKSVPYL